MKLRDIAIGRWFCVLALGWCSSLGAALPPDWQHEQHFDVAAPGLQKFALPPETLDAARPGLEDLRVTDAEGNALPYFIERPVPSPKVTQAAKAFHVSLGAGATVITLETGLALPLDGVTLETPAVTFIKAVRVEGSADGQNWQPLSEGQPIFREQNGASQLRVSVPVGVWHSLRFTVDDARNQAIPFAGARVHAAAAEKAAVEPHPATIVERNENPGETRLTLNIGAANLDIASVRLETTEPLFKRSVTIAVPVISEDAVREQSIAHGSVYRVEVEGQKASSDLTLPVEARVQSRELLLLIRNEDSPPLAITAVTVERRPVFLVFIARQAGAHHLLTANGRCAAPRYDLASFGADLKRVAVMPVKISAIADNPAFHAPEAFAGVELAGAVLDVADWKFRKPVKVTDGVQQVELDLDVISQAGSGFADLRILRGGKQVPYVLNRTSIIRSLAPSVTLANDPKKPKLSRWNIKLPRPGLPLTSFRCEARSPLFERDVTLYEARPDERGDIVRREVGRTTWTQTPERKSREFSIAISGRLESDTLVLETVNGDNPAIELEKFAVFYPATRVLFKAKPGDEPFLYYGNPRVSPPRYDLSLVAAQFLSANKAAAELAAEEPLKRNSWRDSQISGTGGFLLWGILAVVVVALLVIIGRLLPKPPTEE